MIKANFKTYASYVTDSLYQWDLNQVLSVSGLNLSVVPEVHFSNANMDKAIVRQATLKNHIVSVPIPNSLLQDPLTIYAHIGIYEGTAFKVVEKVEIPVIAKERPSDYRIRGADEEIYSFVALENAIANMVTHSEANAISARIDNIIAYNNDTEGNTELIDMRVDIDGNTHDSAGTAVRRQFVNINDKVNKNALSIAKNRIFDYESITIYENSGYLLADGSIYESETAYHCKYTQMIPCIEGDTFGYLGVGQFNAVSCIFYGDTGIVSTGQLYSLDTINPKRITVPAGANGVVFASYARIDTDVVLEVKHYLRPNFEQLENATKQLVAQSKIINDVLPDILSPNITETVATEWIDDHYYSRDGEIVDYENISMGKIKVNPGDIFVITGGVWASVVLYAFTDNVNRLIAGYPVENTVGEPTNETVSVVVPENAAYMYINNITGAKPNAVNSTAVKVLSFTKTKASKNVLENKIYVAVGDSYTEGDFSGWADENGLTYTNSPVIYDSVREMYKTYPWWIAERNNMVLYNCGKCGSIVALDKDYVNGVDGVEITSRDPFSLNRYKELPDEIDYMTFWFGINDAGHTNLGTIDDTDNTTFYGAWNVVLPYLIEKYPLCKMGMIVTTGSTESYRQAVRDIACKWGIPYLDLTGSPNVPLMNNRESAIGISDKAVQLRRNAFMLDNGHFNVAGHEYESTFIENFLRSL